jgi:hypothetical protein
VIFEVLLGARVSRALVRGAIADRGETASSIAKPFGGWGMGILEEVPPPHCRLGGWGATHQMEWSRRWMS